MVVSGSEVATAASFQCQGSPDAEVSNAVAAPDDISRSAYIPEDLKWCVYACMREDVCISF